jgi:hypothetical protein
MRGTPPLPPSSLPPSLPPSLAISRDDIENAVMKGKHGVDAPLLTCRHPDITPHPDIAPDIAPQPQHTVNPYFTRGGSRRNPKTFRALCTGCSTWERCTVGWGREEQDAGAGEGRAIAVLVRG